MGNYCCQSLSSENQHLLSDNNIALFNNLVMALSKHNITIIKSILENSSDDAFNFLIDGKSIYHYIVIYSPFLSKLNLQELCQIIYNNRNKLGSINTLSKTKKYVQIIKTTGGYDINYTDDKTTSVNLGYGYDNLGFRICKYRYDPKENLYTLNGVDALTLLYEIRNLFFSAEKMDDNLDILTNVLNKIKMENDKMEKDQLELKNKLKNDTQ